MVRYLGFSTRANGQCWPDRSAGKRSSTHPLATSATQPSSVAGAVNGHSGIFKVDPVPYDKHKVRNMWLPSTQTSNHLHSVQMRCSDDIIVIDVINAISGSNVPLTCLDIVQGYPLK